MAKHTPAGDNSFALSLAKHGGAAVALVLVVAAAFWGVGRMDAGEAEPVAAGQESTEPPATTPATEAPSSLTPSTEAPSTAPATEAPATPATEAPTVEQTPTEQATTEAPGPSVDPGSVSIQVLDAVHDDAGVGAQGWADQLEADGYRVIVVNKASVTYDVTTVFYTPGNEAAARQIAVQYGFERVDLRPDNLSDSVSIHLVVGKDA